MGNPKEVIEEKSFNDDELEDIMSEIENLEKEFEEGPGVEASQEHNEEVEEEIEEEVVAKKPAPKPVVSLPKKNWPEKSNSSHPSRMDFTVSGDMNMELHFSVGDNSVDISIHPEEGLVISMDGGAKFCLPMSEVSKLKKTGS